MRTQSEIRHLAFQVAAQLPSEIDEAIAVLDEAKRLLLLDRPAAQVRALKSVDRDG